MYKFVEVIPEIKDVKINLEPLPNLCLKCKKGLIMWERIPCPDNKMGCLVLHYGYICTNCYSIFNKVEE